MPMIEIRMTADAMPLDEVERARMIMASVGDAPDLEATMASAASWLLPPAKPEPVSSAVDTPEPTDAEKRLAQAYAAVPSWLLK